jgi:hypothetical protein
MAQKPPLAGIGIVCQQAPKGVLLFVLNYLVDAGTKI